MAVSTYDLGDRVRCTAVFNSTAGSTSYVDPTRVTFTVRDPSGNLSTETSTGSNIMHPSSGTYYLDTDVDEAGTWNVRVRSTGTGKAAQEHWWRVIHPKAI